MVEYLHETDSASKAIPKNLFVINLTDKTTAHSRSTGLNPYHGRAAAKLN